MPIFCQIEQLNLYILSVSVLIWLEEIWPLHLQVHFFYLVQLIYLVLHPAIIVGVVIMIIAVSVVAIVNRRDGTMMPDEREHQIESRGIVISYHMLCTGVILVIGGTWLGWSSLFVIHVLALAFILSEMTRIIVEIHGLRRGY